MHSNTSTSKSTDRSERLATASARTLALVQGGYYLLTGVWPFVDMRSFEAVTGPKADRWLVKTVGGLVAVIGGALVATGVRRGPSTDLVATAVGGALALAGIDTYYASKGRISRVYLLDAVAEVVLVAGWGIAAMDARRRA